MSLTVLIIQGADFPSFFISNKKLDLYNNFSILLIASQLFCFTSFVPDAGARSLVGWSMIIITGQNIVVNLFVSLRGPVYNAYMWIKRAYILRKKTKGKTARVVKNMAKRKLRKGMSSMKSFVFEDMSVTDPNVSQKMNISVKSPTKLSRKSSDETEKKTKVPYSVVKMPQVTALSSAKDADSNESEKALSIIGESEIEDDSGRSSSQVNSLSKSITLRSDGDEKKGKFNIDDFLKKMQGESDIEFDGPKIPVPRHNKSETSLLKKANKKEELVDEIEESDGDAFGAMAINVLSSHRIING